MSGGKLKCTSSENLQWHTLCMPLVLQPRVPFGDFSLHTVSRCCILLNSAYSILQKVVKESSETVVATKDELFASTKNCLALGEK